MTIELSTPDVAGLDAVVRALREWQDEAMPIQWHPGDLGWLWRNGADGLAAAVRVWRREGHLVAAGMLDGPDVFRMTVAPDVRHDDDVAGQVVADVSDPEHGVLPHGVVSVETPDGIRVQDALAAAGWDAGESWTPLRRDLSESVGDVELHVEVVGPPQVGEFTSVHRSAWGSPKFTDEVWRTMAAGKPFADARCLLARDDDGVAVGGVTVWCAGTGRPGLIEPLGVHPDHRGHGYGRALCVAAAAHLAELGASSAVVVTETSRPSAVATYRSAGYVQLPERLDRTLRR